MKNFGFLRRWRFRHALNVSLFIVVALLPVTARAAGIRDVVIPADANGPRIVAQLWTPCATPAPEIIVDHGGIPTTIRGVKDCAVTQKNLPLIIISHGMLEDRFSHHDTAEFLADAGFAVIAINHTQDSIINIRDKSVDDISSFFVRPVDIKRVIDYLTVHPPTSIDIDPHRIGFFGFSRGGYTGLVLAGGVPDFSSLVIPCPEKVLMCDQIREHKIPAYARGYEPRITAYVIADPVNFFPNKLSLQNVKAPIQLWSSERGGMGVRPEDVSAVAMNLPIKPDFHRVSGSGHLSFDCPCSIGQAKAVPQILICSDPPGFDRTDFHRKFNATVADFFRKNLPG